MTKNAIKYIPIKEFRELGFLQEVNRQFMHPLGMAFEININEDGTEEISGIWDYRNDPEGISYHEAVVALEKFKNNAKYVSNLQEKAREVRFHLVGYAIQPVDA